MGNAYLPAMVVEVISYDFKDAYLCTYKKFQDIEDVEGMDK